MEKRNESNHKLTERQRRFVDLYLELGNASEAAQRAGYKRTYAAGAMRQSAVQAYLKQRRSQMPAQSAEIVNFLTAVMRGTIQASQIRTEAAIQLGIRAGLWNTQKQALEMLEMIEKGDLTNE